jgi:hypothetical protein
MSRTDTPSFLTNLRKIMGQQSNKIQKRRRRLAYLERQKVKAKEAAILRPVRKKVTSKKKAETAPVAAAE